MVTNKNFAIGRFISLWWNDGQDGKSGYWSVQVQRQYKDKTGMEIKEKISMFTSDALQLAAELENAKQILLHPREIIRKVEETGAVSTAPVSEEIGNSDVSF